MMHPRQLKNGSTRFRNYYAEAKNNILQQAENLKDTSFFVCDYSEVRDIKGCLIYCDPPYEGTKQYSNATNFDYAQFWQFCRELSKDNIVVVSEQNAPDDFTEIWRQDVSRSIKPNDKSKATEKLYIYKTNL